MYLFFLWLTSFCVTGSRFIGFISADSHLFLFIVYMYHNFFACSSVDEHVGSSHVQAAVNSAAMNIGVPVSFWITVFSGHMSIVELLGHIVVLILIFWEIKKNIFLCEYILIWKQVVKASDLELVKGPTTASQAGLSLFPLGLIAIASVYLSGGCLKWPGKLMLFAYSLRTQQSWNALTLLHRSKG